MTLFLCLNAFSSSFVSCSSIVHSHSAWRLKHHQMAIHNEHLHSLASAKDNSLRMAFHVSMIPLSGSFYSSLPVVFRSESNILLGEVLDLTTEMHTPLLLCVFICDRGDFDKQKRKYSHMVFSSLTRLSSHVAYADMASSVGGLTDKMKQNSFCYFRLCTTVELIITFFQWGHNERLSRL